MACEVCDVESVLEYGAVCEEIVDVHLVELLPSSGKRETGLDDLAVLCPNCHGAIHRAMLNTGTTLTPAALRRQRSRHRSH